MQIIWLILGLFTLVAPFVILVVMVVRRPRNEGGDHGGGFDGMPPYTTGG